MKNEMLLESGLNDGVMLLSLTGKLNARTALSLKEKVVEFFPENHVNIVIDMSSVDFVDSTGLGSLVACLRSVKEKNGDIKISGLKPNVQSVFELIRLNKLFEVFKTSSQAVKSYKK